MTVSKSDLAYLADVVYDPWALNAFAKAAPSGGRYRAVYILDDASGYYGVVFEHEDTRELVVAHRGTEPTGDFVRDILLTDAQMVVQRINQQRSAAIWLVEQALKLSDESPDKPPVTLTGHSLGGSLAQLTALHFGLSAETFNAFGAADIALNYSLEMSSLARGDLSSMPVIVNHVRVTDIVSAAGRHLGTVVIYATERDHELVADLDTYGIYSLRPTRTRLQCRVPANDEWWKLEDDSYRHKGTVSAQERAQ